MKQLLVALAAIALIGVGVTVVSHTSKTPASQDQALGAAASTDHYAPEYFHNNLYANQFFGMGSVSASSSSTTAANITLALGASPAGQFTIGTSTPGTNKVNASTTAVSATSFVFVQSTATTTIPGVTCNATPPTSTVVTTMFASTTNTSLNGFQVTAGTIPTTNPLCYNYWVVNTAAFK